MIDKKQLIEELLECVKDATDKETQITGLSMCATLMKEVLDEALKLHVVSVSLPDDDEIEKKAEFRQKPRNHNNENKEEFIYGFMQGADWVKSIILHNER